MWITSRMAKNIKNSRPAAKGLVTRSDSSRVGITTDSKHIDVPVAAPWGVVSAAPAGAEAVVVDTSSGITCVGFECKGEDELEAGEIMLRSLGATLVLKNDGRVLINGKEAGGV